MTDYTKAQTAERKIFEKWFRKEIDDAAQTLRLDGDGNYKHRLAAWAWKGWNARMKVEEYVK